MAVKDSYKIPADLNASYLDQEISVKSDSGMGLRPTPIKVILFWVAGIFAGMFLVMATPLGQGHIWQTILFMVLWCILIFILGRYDRSKEMQLSLLPVLFKFIKKKNRYVTTRMDSPAYDFLNITNYRSIDDNGIIHYKDDTYGLWFSVVGSASVLLFEEDMNAIVNRVDQFWQKQDTEGEIIFITCKEPQMVWEQIGNLSNKYKALPPELADHEDIKNLVNTQYYILRDEIGKYYKSIHQYMIIKADNRESLKVFETNVLSEVNSSTLMIKSCRPLYKDVIDTVLHKIYGSTESTQGRDTFGGVS